MAKNIANLVVLRFRLWYDKGMKSHAFKKSSLTLARSEVPLVNKLRRRLKFKSNTQVIRFAIKALNDKMDRDILRDEFVRASTLVREANAQEYSECGDIEDEVPE